MYCNDDSIVSVLSTDIFVVHVILGVSKIDCISTYEVRGVLNEFWPVR